MRLLMVFFSALVFCASSPGSDQPFVIGVSPKLSKLLSENLLASTAFTNAFFEASKKKAFKLYYFYSDDESEPKAFHYYPDQSSICFVLRENQHVWDEYSCLLFEALNVKQEKEFGRLCNEAMAGALSKDEFAKAMLRAEFEAVKSTRQILSTLKPTEAELAGSKTFGDFLKCPLIFEDFLPYIRRLSARRDPLKEYGERYDWLRKSVPAVGK